MTSNAKRYACDRCRDLKLRCTRNTEEAPCDRCLRVDARCVTSSGRLLGRPPTQHKSHVNTAICQDMHHAQSNQQMVTGDFPNTSMSCRSMGASGAAGMPIHSQCKLTHESHNQRPGVCTDPGLSESDGMLCMQLEDIYEPYGLLEATMRTTCHNSLDGTHTNNGNDSHAQEFQDPDELCGSDIGIPDMQPSPYANLHRSNCKRPYTPDSSTHYRNDTNTKSKTGRPNSDWTTSLMNALGSVSRQLDEPRAQACNLSTQPVGACTFEGISPDLNFLDTPVCDGASDGSSRAKLLGKAVIATMRFILVLHIMPPSPVDWTGMVGEDSAAEDAASRPMSNRTLPTSVFSANAPPQVTLILLSTYLQLGELFDIILSPTVQFLNDLANASPEPGNPTGKTGCPLMSSTALDPQRPHDELNPMDPRAQRSAQGVTRPHSQDILMTIRVVEHQLHTLEKLIGLPAQYCLGWCNNASTDAMDFHDTSVLAKAVMRQTLVTLLSLKKTLDCIQACVKRSPISQFDC